MVKQFQKILVANRGEVAVRIIRACRELGIPTVAIYSQADRHSLHVKMADESVCIGPPAIKQSYLNMAAIMSAVDLTGADAVHPGYGFLAENHLFAKICEQCGVKFIGPTHTQIELMSDKLRALALAKKAGVPCLPGTEALAHRSDAVAAAEKIGFPVVIKTSAGGDARGVLIAYHADQVASQFEKLRSEAQAALGDGTLYLEKYCESPRHIEVQVMGDESGKYLHFGERECSIQKEHRKIMEEAPAPFLDEALRAKMITAARSLCAALKYQNLGTVEFIVDAKTKDFYFIEMNTRLQVEHPVTEMVTGIDLVKEQILLAAGNLSSLEQKDIKVLGHAIECRILADVPRLGQPLGKISTYLAPGGPGVRIDSFVYQDYQLTPQYDPLLSKLICLDETREKAINKAKFALMEYCIDGIPTNISLLGQVLRDKDFLAGDFDTHFLDRFLS